MSDWEPRFTRLMHSDPGTWTAAMLEPFSLRELQGACELMGIATSGVKTVVVARLLDAANLRVLLATAETPPDLTGRYKLRELQALCKRAGVYGGSNKYGAAASLLNWRNACRRRGQTALREAQAQRCAPVQTALRFEEGVAA